MSQKQQALSEQLNSEYPSLTEKLMAKLKREACAFWLIRALSEKMQMDEARSGDVRI